MAKYKVTLTDDERDSIRYANASPVGPSCRFPETSGSHRLARDSR